MPLLSHASADFFICLRTTESGLYRSPRGSAVKTLERLTLCKDGSRMTIGRLRWNGAQTRFAGGASE
jgi:hypothetical protein